MACSGWLGRVEVSRLNPPWGWKCGANDMVGEPNLAHE